MEKVFRAALITSALMTLSACSEGAREYTPTHVCKNAATGREVRAAWFNGTHFRYYDHNGVHRTIGEENSDQWDCKAL